MMLEDQKEGKNIQKTYNSGDSPVVTHLTTDPPLSRSLTPHEMVNYTLSGTRLLLLAEMLLF